MRVLIAVLGICFFSGESFAQEPTPLTRVFKVKWDKELREDGEVQMCDDTYYSYAEILVPTYPAGFDIESLAAQCAPLKMDRKESIVMEGTGYTRVRLTGSWQSCEIAIEKPVTKQSPEKSKFVVTLADGC